MKASLELLGTGPTCDTCGNDHPPFTICGRCDARLTAGECFICPRCDSRALEEQERRQSLTRRDQTLRAYRDAGIPFEIVSEYQDFHLHPSLEEWAQSDDCAWAGYADDSTPERRQDIARALLRRMRSRVPHGAVLTSTDALAMRGPVELADVCRNLESVELLAIDIPGPIDGHAEMKIFTMLSARHWSGKNPRATLISRGLSIGESDVMNEIFRMVRSRAPERKRAPVESIKGSESTRFPQRCSECRAEMVSAHETTRAWLCRTCYPKVIAADARFGSTIA